MHWTTDRIRQSFLDFFKSRGHAILPSAPLIVQGDPTLLFTNAGMVQFKDYFLGLRTPPARRVADCQKCLRISGKHNDLEAVGRDSYHHTFFEMLGNWSFGDYYKAEAIAWHWELVTKVWGVDPKLLWATVHQDDQEAEQIWVKLGVLPRDRILRFGDKDNFWEMGESGPCGPNSEITIDRGERACDRRGHPREACAVNVDGCARFVELGNLVFIQYDRDASGKLTALPERHVDTGTGLERVAAALQSLESGRVLGDYDTDVFQTIIARIESAAKQFGNGARYGSNPAADVLISAIADHARAISFLIAEGLRPGNTDREYVLRRLMRRAIRHGRRLNIHGVFLDHVCQGVIQAMGAAYPELVQAAERTSEIVSQEEEQFGDILERGLQLIDRWEGDQKHRAFDPRTHSQIDLEPALVLPGKVAFELYDTYGFPLDLTQDVLCDRGIKVDVDGFNHLMEEQRERGRAARKDVVSEIDIPDLTASEFIRGRYDHESIVLERTQRADELWAVWVRETPFYPEGGGQVGDRGVIEAESGVLLEVVDTRKTDVSIVHICRFLRGEAKDLARGARVRLRVDRQRREAAMLNHSATHILHYALREVLGEHVRQAGSLVAPERLRFDFSHSGPVAAGDLLEIEEEINARIRENAEVSSEEMAYGDAIGAGALAFFGDKYGDRVRVIRIGDFSTELCGGTHVSRTGEIGVFKLAAESGVAAGVRRVEAHTGQGALESIRRREKILDEIARHLRAPDAAALERLQRLLAREKELEKKLRALEHKLVSGERAGAGEGERLRTVAGIKVVIRKLEGVEPGALREMADRLRQKHGSAVVALGSNLGDGKVALLVAVTPDLTARVKAGDIIKQIAPIVGGSGGGRPDLAQAGGRDAGKLEEALERVFSAVR